MFHKESTPAAAAGDSHLQVIAFIELTKHKKHPFDEKKL